jgi:hypothetical protein
LTKASNTAASALQAGVAVLADEMWASTAIPERARDLDDCARHLDVGLAWRPTERTKLLMRL